MIENLYSAGGISLFAADMSAAVGFAGLTSEVIELGTEFRTQRRFASLFESQAAIASQSPMIDWATSQIGTAYGLMDSVGRCITNDTGKAGLNAYLSQHDKCSARDLTDCRAYNFAEGYLLPGTLSVPHGGVATLTGKAIGSSSTANHPLQYADNVAAPTYLADTESYGLYQQTVGGVTLSGVKSLTYEHGIEVTTESADGAIWPEWISVGSVVQRITLSGINPKWLGASQIPIDGRPLTHANTTLRIVRHEDDGQGAYQDLTESVHITLTVNGLGAITTAASASDETGAATTDLVLICLHDGTNNPVLIDTTAALA